MLDVFAEFETAIRRERQLEGIQAAKAKGVYGAARRRSKLPPSPLSRRKASERPRSPSGSRSAGPACTDWRDKRASRVRETFESEHRALAAARTQASRGRRGRGGTELGDAG